VSDPTMLVLEGPPGTGKTYRAAREAVVLIDGAIPNDAGLADRYRTLVEAGRIVPVTFHPSYAYEDFVEGYRPSLTDEGHIRYSVEPGPFRAAVDACRAVPPLSALFAVGQKLPTGGGGPYEVVEVHPGGVVLSRANTRADAVNATNFYYAPFWTVKRILTRGVKADDVAIGGSDYDKRQAVAKTLEFPPDQLAGVSHIAAVARHVETKLGSVQNPSGPVVLVIDEINRADLSRVLGELITLLEADKREGGPEERSALLPYSRELLVVPSDLHIVATMNTSDRSLSVFDLALRRRFRFEYVAPDPGLCPDNYGSVDVRSWLRYLNRRIASLLDRDACIGHSEFMIGKLEKTRENIGAPDDPQGKRKALARSVVNYVVPTLLAMSGRDWNAVHALLGSRLIREGAAVEFDSEEFDSAAAFYTVDPRCVPDTSEWDDAYFAECLTSSEVQDGGAIARTVPGADGVAAGDNAAKHAGAGADDEVIAAIEE
jgi:5-methylcytosine-specific restriction enzyme B